MLARWFETIARAQMIAALAVFLMAYLAPNLRAQETSAAAQWEWRDEIVYVVIVHKFYNGDAANDVMPRRYGNGGTRSSMSSSFTNSTTAMPPTTSCRAAMGRTRRAMRADSGAATWPASSRSWTISNRSA